MTVKSSKLVSLGQNQWINKPKFILDNRKRYSSLLFQGRRHPHFLAHGSILHHSVFSGLHLCSYILSLLLKFLPSFLWLCWTSSDNPGSSFHLKSAKFLVPSKLSHPQVLDIRTFDFVGGHNSGHTRDRELCPVD